MEKEYDFSKAEVGKFYKPNAKLNIPVYLDDDVFAFVIKVAEVKKLDLSTVVNQLIHSDMQIAKTISLV